MPHAVTAVSDFRQWDAARRGRLEHMSTPTMSFDERIVVAETIAEEAHGAVPLAFGGQSTSTLELVRLAKAAQSMVFGTISFASAADGNHRQRSLHLTTRARGFPSLAADGGLAGRIAKGIDAEEICTWRWVLLHIPSFHSCR